MHISDATIQQKFQLKNFGPNTIKKHAQQVSKSLLSGVQKKVGVCILGRHRFVQHMRDSCLTKAKNMEMRISSQKVSLVSATDDGISLLSPSRFCLEDDRIFVKDALFSHQ